MVLHSPVCARMERKIRCADDRGSSLPGAFPAIAVNETDDESVLAAKRGESRYAYVAHKYEFAGGKVEAGESEEDALRREIFEELGAKIQVGGLFCRLEHDYPDFSVRLSVYFCKFLTPYFSKEHEALAWLPIEELDAAEWAPADAPAVERLKKLYREGGAAFCGIRQAEDEKR